MKLNDTTDISIREADEESELTPAQQKVLSLLMAGRSYIDAAEESGISDRSIRRWRACCPKFEHALRTRIQSVRDACAIQAAASLQAALTSLLQIASDPTNARAIAAIRLIFEIAGPLHRVSDSSSVQEVFEDQTMTMLQQHGARLR